MIRLLHRCSSRLAAAALALASAGCAGTTRPAGAPLPTRAEAQAETPTVADAPAPDRVDDTVELERMPNGTVSAELLGSVRYDLPVEANQWVAAELGFLTQERHDVVGRWLERGARYAAFVQETFAAAGIPRDLHHLAMVESGYQPTARSHAGAVGMWQFMRGTGRGMGLRIDDSVDERMDPVRSTRAAARHLRQLWSDFGRNWALAAAAYNAGSGRISRGLASTSSTTFWELAERGTLARETRRYVPRLYAVTIIARDPGRFGYVTAGAASRPFAFDSLRVDLPTPLAVLAGLGGVSLAELGELNPHLLTGVAPAGYWVWVPQGQGEALRQGYAASEFRRRGGFAWYTLRRGEDASSVAQAAGLSPQQLRELNVGLALERAGRGDRVRLYADAARLLAAAGGERLAGRPLLGEPVGGSEAGSSVASTAAGPAADDWTSGLVRVRATTAAAAAPVPLARAARAADEDDAPARRRAADDALRTHRVARGETLRGIARRYEVSLSALRRMNDLEVGEQPRRGQRLRIPRGEDAPRTRAGTRTARGERPGVRRHRVRHGETLTSIARDYDTTITALREANDLPRGAVLQPGQRLRIPRAGRR